MSRTLTILYTLDSFVLALLTLGGCDIGDTLSSKAWQLEAKGRTHGRVFRRLIDWLFALIEPEHCYRAYLTYRRIRGVV
jgi:hypothetical protein